MKKFRVIALSVGGPGNKIYHSGDIVFENNFKPGRANELVKSGFLAEEDADLPSVVPGVEGIERIELKDEVNIESFIEEDAEESSKQDFESIEEKTEDNVKVDIPVEKNYNKNNKKSSRK